MTTSQSLKGQPVYPHDLPDEAHPPVIPQLEVPADTMPPEWINAEALHAAVACIPKAAIADILTHARYFRAFIKGDTE